MNFDDFLFSDRRPTARERWAAFWRLYRLARREEHGRNLMAGAMDCLRVLGFGDWIARVEETDPLETGFINHFDKCIWRRYIERQRILRLYGSFTAWHDNRGRDGRIASQVASEAGYEVTPDEVAAVRCKLMKFVRDRCMRRGVPAPRNDEELRAWMRRAMGR